MLNISEHILQSYFDMFRFGVLSIITSLAIHHSNVGAQLRRVTTKGSPTLFECKLLFNVNYCQVDKCNHFGTYYYNNPKPQIESSPPTRDIQLGSLQSKRNSG